MATGGTGLPAAAPDERMRFGTEAFYASIGRAFLAMCAFIPVLWGIEGLNVLFGGALDRAGGIEPRSLTGIDGVVFAPLLHASFSHVAANSVPLLLLGTFVLAGQTRRFFLITAFIALVSGLTVWVFGPSNSITVGASGVIFGYLGYLLLRGLIERRWWSLGISLLMGLLFGWQLVGILPGAEHVSWQGHLGGFLAGLVAAILFRQPRARRPKPADGDSSSPTITMPGAGGLDLGPSDKTIEMPGKG